MVETKDYHQREIPKNCPDQKLCQRLREFHTNVKPIDTNELCQLMNDAQTQMPVDRKYEKCWESQENEYSCFMRTEGRRLWMFYEAPSYSRDTIPNEISSKNEKKF